MVCRIHGVNSCDEVINSWKAISPQLKYWVFSLLLSHIAMKLPMSGELFKLIISCVISGTKIVVLSLQDFTAMNMSESRY